MDAALAWPPLERPEGSSNESFGTWPVVMSTISLASWLVSRGRLTIVTSWMVCVLTPTTLADVPSARKGERYNQRPPSRSWLRSPTGSLA